MESMTGSPQAMHAKENILSLFGIFYEQSDVIRLDIHERALYKLQDPMKECNYEGGLPTVSLESKCTLCFASYRHVLWLTYPGRLDRH